MDRKPEKYNRYLKETAFIDLNPEHRDAFHSLYKSIVDVNGFQLVILQFNDPRYRDLLIEKIASIGKKSTLIRLDNKAYPTFHDFEEEIERLAQNATVINVVNLENWLFPKDAEKRITGFNYHRESLAADCPATLLLWMTEPDIKAFALGAPDMWAWRSAVLDFHIEKERASLEWSEDRPFVDGLLLRGKVNRINEIKVFLEKKDKGTSEKQKSSLLNELGRLYFAIGKNSEALRYFEKSLEIVRNIGEKSGEGTILNNISQIFKVRGNYETTLSYLEQSLKICREIGDKSGEGTTFNNISQIFKAKGDYETALSYLEQSLKSSREIGNKRVEGATLNNISQIFKARGDTETALSYLKQSLKICREIGDKSGEGAILNNISQIFKAKGDTETTLSYLEQSLKSSRGIGDKSGEGTTLNNISQIFKARGDTGTALSYLEQSLIIQREIGDKSGEISTLHNMASIALNNDDTQKAFEYEAAAYKLALETGDAMGLYHVGKLFGKLLFSAGKKEEGITVLERTVKIGKESQLPGLEEVEQILQNLMSQQLTTNNDLEKTDP